MAKTKATSRVIQPPGTLPQMTPQQWIDQQNPVLQDSRWAVSVGSEDDQTETLYLWTLDKKKNFNLAGTIEYAQMGANVGRGDCSTVVGQLGAKIFLLAILVP